MSSSAAVARQTFQALDKIKELQDIIDSQQQVITEQQQTINQLKQRNDELRKERDQLKQLNDELREERDLYRTGEQAKHASFQSPLEEAETGNNTVIVHKDDNSSTPRVKKHTSSEEDGTVTYRRSNSRNSSQDKRAAVYISSPTVDRKTHKKELEAKQENTSVINTLKIPHQLGSNMSINSCQSDASSTSSSIDQDRSSGGFLSPTLSGYSISSSVCSTTPDIPHDHCPIISTNTTTSSTRPFMADILPNSKDDNDDDEDEDLFSSPMRMRLATVSTTVARRQAKQSMVNPLTKKSSLSNLKRQNSFPSRGKKGFDYEASYLSPDMEMKIQQMFQQVLVDKYGSLEMLTKAAVTIQNAYRTHKINSHFKKLRSMQQDSLRERRLTMSVRYTKSPSIMASIKSDQSLKLASNYKMNEIHDKFRDITETRASPSLARREIRKNVSLNKHNLELSLSPPLEETSGELSKSPSVFSGFESLHEATPKRQLTQQLSILSRKRKQNIGTNIFNRKPQKGIQYLVLHGVLQDDPLDVAKFLKECDYLSKEKIGEFVGEIRYEFNMAVLECLVQLIDLTNKPIDEAIRNFQLLFRMPGEAQKIDKIMQVFATEYYESCKDLGVIKSEDAAYVLSFAIMMLHTDLHNPSVKRHMTKKDWLRMNRGTNDEENYPDDFLLGIYDRIQQREFATGRDHTHTVMDIKKQIVGPGCPPLLNPQRRFISVFWINQVVNPAKRSVKKHKRALYLFNDVVLIVKAIGTNKYEFRKFFTLLSLHTGEFNNQNYKYGVFMKSDTNGETYYFNCEERDVLIVSLSETVAELKEMERERMLERGDYTTKDNPEGSGGNLLSSLALSTSTGHLHSLTTDDINFKPTKATTEINNRTSRDSGFASPHRSSPLPTVTIVSPAVTVATTPTSYRHSAIANSSNDRITPPPDMPPRSKTPDGRRVTMKVISSNSSANTNGGGGATSSTPTTPTKGASTLGANNTKSTTGGSTPTTPIRGHPTFSTTPTKKVVTTSTPSTPPLGIPAAGYKGGKFGGGAARGHQQPDEKPKDRHKRKDRLSSSTN